MGFVKECGAMLQDLSPQGLHGKLFQTVLRVLLDKLVSFW